MSYEIVEPDPPPDLPGEVEVGRSPEAVFERMARDLVAHALNCGRKFGNFHLALSGHPVAAPFYRLLLTDPVCRRLPWKKTHLWQVEERLVADGTDDEGRPPGWALIGDLFAHHSGVPRAQQHPIPIDARSPGRRYEADLRAALEWRERGQDRLDYVLLVLGPDGSVGGLHPDRPVVDERRRFVRRDADDPEAARAVTMTLPLLNAARFVAVLALGELVRPALARLVDAHAGRVEESARSLPALGLRPVGGVTGWYLDEEARPAASATGSNAGADDDHITPR